MQNEEYVMRRIARSGVMRRVILSFALGPIPVGSKGFAASTRRVLDDLYLIRCDGSYYHLNERGRRVLELLQAGYDDRDRHPE